MDDKNITKDSLREFLDECRGVKSPEQITLMLERRFLTPSLGERMIEWANSQRVELMPWQKNLLRDNFSHTIESLREGHIHGHSSAEKLNKIIEDSNSERDRKDPLPLPESEDCKPGEYYLVRTPGEHLVIGHRDNQDKSWPWSILDLKYSARGDGCRDDQITILARLIPDRDTPTA